jgi:hypothetical protein
VCLFIPEGIYQVLMWQHLFDEQIIRQRDHQYVIYPQEFHDTLKHILHLGDV